LQRRSAGSEHDRGCAFRCAPYRKMPTRWVEMVGSSPYCNVNMVKYSGWRLKRCLPTKETGRRIV
jgi:hypothetical protein